MRYETIDPIYRLEVERHDEGGWVAYLGTIPDGSDAMYMSTLPNANDHEAVGRGKTPSKAVRAAFREIGL